jgi:ABC-type uncharacterized transport system ATPase subunit
VYNFSFEIFLVAHRMKMSLEAARAVRNRPLEGEEWSTAGRNFFAFATIYSVALIRFNERFCRLHSILGLATFLRFYIRY